MDDWELLTRYAKEGSQEAFSALVSRHLNLVYSAARRQVNSSALVEEIVQSVFLDLARQAACLKPEAPLASWLYVVTRVTAQKALRTETRRQAREQAAFELSTMNAIPSAWSQLAPLLDEAVATLPEPDRSAIVLRFFENQSLREVGAAFGITDDAAQKRVSRALDQLRARLAQRGIALTAAGLATDLSAHAIEIAPATLAVTISTGGLLTVAASLATLETAKTIAMTMLQKTALASILALAAGAGIYEARVFHLQTAEAEQREADLERLRNESALLAPQHNDLARRVATARTQLSAIPVDPTADLDPATASVMQAWLARAARIRQTFKDNPQAWIPELSLLDESDWINAVADAATLDPANQRKTLAAVRQAAVNKFSSTIKPAIKAYLEAHGNVLPATVAEFGPNLTAAIDPAIFDRWEMIHSGRVEDIPTGRGSLSLIREKSVSDIEEDGTFEIGPQTSGWTKPAVRPFVTRAIDAYAKAHAGQKPTTPEQLQPYLAQPIAPALVEPFLH